MDKKNEKEEEEETEDEAGTGINDGVAEFDWLAGWLLCPSLICRWLQDQEAEKCY
jgi:hypothetical protein